MAMKLGTENISKHLLERHILDVKNHVLIITVFASYCVLTHLGSIMVRFINKTKVCA